jgi:GDSL-like Lipase/Acylhydrolase family
MTPRLDRRTLLAIGALAVVAFACSEGDDAGLEPLSPLGTGGDPAGGEESGSQPTVAVIGDSITFMSTDPLRADLSGIGLDVRAIDAQIGRRITAGEGGRPYPGTDIVEFIANSDPPDVWVIALGTNDIGQYADAEEFAVQVQALLDLLPDDAPLAWVDTWAGDRLEETRLVNDTLRAVVGERDNAVVVDWFSHGNDDGVVSDDQVHPTPDGTLVFGQVVADGVETLFESL